MAHLQPGGIILFHDGGGNRDQTVAALPIVIARIQAAGYRIAPVCAPDPHAPVGRLIVAGRRQERPDHLDGLGLGSGQPRSDRRPPLPRRGDGDRGQGEGPRHPGTAVEHHRPVPPGTPTSSALRRSTSARATATPRSGAPRWWCRPITRFDDLGAAGRPGPLRPAARAGPAGPARGRRSTTPAACRGGCRGRRGPPGPVIGWSCTGERRQAAGGGWSGWGMHWSSSSATVMRSRFSQVISLAGSLRTLYSRKDCSRLS